MPLAALPTAWPLELVAKICTVDRWNVRLIAGTPAHWNNQLYSCLPLGTQPRCSAKRSILARRVTSHPCQSDHVLSPRRVRIIEGLTEDWRRLDEGINHLRDGGAHATKQRS